MRYKKVGDHVFVTGSVNVTSSSNIVLCSNPGRLSPSGRYNCRDQSLSGQLDCPYRDLRRANILMMCRKKGASCNIEFDDNSVHRKKTQYGAKLKIGEDGSILVKQEPE